MRRFDLVVAVASAAIWGAACGGSSDGPVEEMGHAATVAEVAAQATATAETTAATRPAATVAGREAVSSDDVAVAPEVAEMRRLVDCLEGRGISVLVTPDGSGFRADPGQGDFPRHVSECRELTGLLAPPVPLTTDEIREVYDRWLETAACLRANGYDPDEPTGVETFVEQWPRGTAWNPYLSIETRTLGEFERLNVLCSQ